MKDKAHLIKKFATLISVAKLTKEDKQTIVSSFTDFKHTSSKDMSEKELELAIDYLNEIAPQVKTGANDTADRMRKKIIGMYREMGKVSFDNEKQELVADMPAINKAMQEKWSKKLNDYSITELSRIIGVLQHNILPAYYKKKS